MCIHCGCPVEPPTPQINCPDCGEDFAETLTTCPTCGGPVVVPESSEELSEPLEAEPVSETTVAVQVQRSSEDVWAEFDKEKTLSDRVRLSLEARRLEKEEGITGREPVTPLVKKTTLPKYDPTQYRSIQQGSGLASCKHCGHRVARGVDKCPNCGGMPMSTANYMVRWLVSFIAGSILLLLFLALGFLIYNGGF